MATELLAAESGIANSDDFTVADGSIVSICLKGTVSFDASVAVTLKDDDNDYTTVGKLTSANPAASLSSPGVYRVSRLDGTCGVFRA